MSESDSTQDLGESARAEKTEASLAAWREVSAERRKQWEVNQAQAVAAARARRANFAQTVAVGVGVTAVLLALGILVSDATRGTPISVAAAPDGDLMAAPALVETDVAAQPEAEKLATPEAETASEAAARKMAEAPTPVPLEPGKLPEGAAAKTEFVERPKPEMKKSITSVNPSEVRTWTDATYAWVSFQVDTTEPVWLRWRDAKDRWVLDEMKCFKADAAGHACRAGRSHTRIAAALAAGAEPGLWTVEMCTTAGCDPVTTFEAGGTGGTPVSQS